MKISSKTRYAATAIIDIALNSKVIPASVSSISKRQKISRIFLEQIFRDLKKEGIIISQKGFKGGYKLAKKPEDISLKDIFTAVDESTTPVFCLKSSGLCQQSLNCRTKKVWQDLDYQINSFLDKVKVSDLLKD